MTPPIVKRYLIAFEKYKWFGVASFALVLVGSTVVAMQPEPPINYLASSALSYTRPPVSFSLTGNAIQQQGQTLNQENLLSNDVIKAVAKKLSINPQTIGSRINLTLPKRGRTGELESTIIELKYADSDSNRAKSVLKELMAVMTDVSGKINNRRLEDIINKISERLPRAKQELEAAEQKLQLYDRRERPAILASENGSLLSAITTSQNGQRQLGFTISGIDAQIQSLKNKLGLTVEQAYVSSALSADTIIASLRSQIFQAESQISLYQKDLRPQHPTMIQLQRQKQAAEELLQQRADEVLGGGGIAAPFRGNIPGIRSQSSLDPTRQNLANQMVNLQTQRDTLQQQLAQEIKQEARLRQEYSLIPNKQLERSRLEQTVTLKKSVYDQMQTKLTDAKTAEAETVSSLTVAREPIAIAEIVKPKSVPMTLAVGGFLGIVIGGAVIFLLGSMEGTIKTEADIRNSLKQRETDLLAELPLILVDDLESQTIPVIISPDSPYLEFYEKLRSNLRRVGGKNLKVILITSISKYEGKTTTVYNLGIASARAGKRTLIMEVDLRSPSSASSLKVAPDPDATIQPLRYYRSLSECIRLVPDVENLYIIPSPGSLRQSAAILESSEIRQLIEDARERYDLVILDTSPLSLSNDPLLIQPYTDGMILVTRPNLTQEGMLSEAIDQLTESELGLLGAIINGADIAVTLPEPVRANSASEIELEMVTFKPESEPEPELENIEKLPSENLEKSEEVPVSLHKK